MAAMAAKASVISVFSATAGAKHKNTFSKIIVVALSQAEGSRLEMGYFKLSYRPRWLPRQSERQATRQLNLSRAVH
jgi:hypothetical protein